MNALARATLAALLLLVAGAAQAKVQTKEITYQQDGTPLQGFLAWDDAAQGQRPGVLVVHEWWGHNQHARNQAIRLAKAGYVGFALDMYGQGKVAEHPKDAQAFMQEATKDPAVAKARFDAALALLKEQPQVDAEQIGAVGYCFGGGVVLDMARAGEDLKAVATFHGAVAPHGPPPAPGTVMPRIFVATGAQDPMVTKAKVQAFEQEMKQAGAKFRVVTYPHAKHGFTNPDAGKYGMDGLAYDAAADRASWKAAMAMFHRVLKE
jgi:dienelactone hydrolase